MIVSYVQLVEMAVLIMLALLMHVNGVAVTISMASVGSEASFASVAPLVVVLLKLKVLVSLILVVRGGL